MKTWMIDKRPDDWEFMDDGNHQTEEVRSALLNHTWLGCGIVRRRYDCKS
jgi:hypothetical protein